MAGKQQRNPFAFVCLFHSEHAFILVSNENWNVNMPHLSEAQLKQEAPTTSAGFDENWHIAYPLSGAESISIPEQCQQLFAALVGSSLFDEEEERHVFPNGTDFYICSNWADLTRAYFGEDRVVVLGYLHEDNPTSAISAEYEGHDFALIDDRYIVDGWLTGGNLETKGRQTPGFFDLENEADKAEIIRLYGDRSTWEPSASCYQGPKF